MSRERGRRGGAGSEDDGYVCRLSTRQHDVTYRETLRVCSSCMMAKSYTGHIVLAKSSITHCVLSATREPKCVPHFGSLV